jgi:hypothetical protein
MEKWHMQCRIIRLAFHLVAICALPLSLELQTVRADEKKGDKVPAEYKKLRHDLITGKVKEVTVGSKPLIAKHREVWVIVVTNAGTRWALVIDLDAKKANLMLKNVMTAVEKNYEIAFSQSEGSSLKPVKSVSLIIP